MALWRTATFESMETMLDYMNGALIGIVNLTDGADVDLKTLIIDAGAGNKTCTFSAAKGRDWTLAEILAKIEGTSGLEGLSSVKILKIGATSHPMDRRLLLSGDPGITIRGTGTANAELGYAEGTTPGDDTVQVVTPQAAVERAYRNVDGQDTWTVLLYS